MASPMCFRPKSKGRPGRCGREGSGPRNSRAARTAATTACSRSIPSTPRDHDDALSIERLDGGGARIGVYIADVSHYVREGDALDAEAWERGTSVYLVDRVIPMLPHGLSSDLCSLVPGEDRLTLAAFLEVDAGGSVTRIQFVRAVIRSAHRLAYEEAQEILDGRYSAAARADPGLRDDLRALLRVARAFRERRRARGSLDFELPEAHVVLDDEGAPIDVRRRERLASHMLVEDLMIATNEAVARWAIEEGVPVPYRIHEEPNEEKLETLRLLADEFGLSFPGRNPRPRDFPAAPRRGEGAGRGIGHLAAGAQEPREGALFRRQRGALRPRILGLPSLHLADPPLP